MEAKSTFLEMKRVIKKNLDKFKEKQIGVENFNMFKRLSNQQSSLSPKIIKINSEAEGDTKSKKHLNEQKTSSISNIISILNEDIEGYNDKKFSDVQENKKKNLKKKILNNRDPHLILPHINSHSKASAANENCKIINVKNNYNNLEIHVDYYDLKNKISDELDSKHSRLKNQDKKRKIM